MMEKCQQHIRVVISVLSFISLFFPLFSLFQEKWFVTYSSVSLFSCLQQSSEKNSKEGKAGQADERNVQKDKRKAVDEEELLLASFLSLFYSRNLALTFTAGLFRTDQKFSFIKCRPTWAVNEVFLSWLHLCSLQLVLKQIILTWTKSLRNEKKPAKFRTQKSLAKTSFVRLSQEKCLRVQVHCKIQSKRLQCLCSSQE